MLGAASLAASGALYLTREHQKAPVINVQPAPVTVQQAPAPVVNVAPAPAPVPAPAPAPACEEQAAVVERPIPLPRPRPPKRAHRAAKQLKAKWVAPQDKPFNLGDLFNARR
jgi:hypothetical protein